MHDTLEYMGKDPAHRRWHHHQMTFGLLYAFSENFVLPLSHDEVVHGKGSILARMPGDAWQKFANLRAYYGFMWGHPGKKLLFMGQEFGQGAEWNYQQSLDWHLLGHRLAQGRAAAGQGPEPAPTASCRRCISATATAAASPGSRPTMPRTRCSPGCATASRARRRCWW